MRQILYAPLLASLVAAAPMLMPLAAAAQTDIALGGLDADPTLPVEIAADSLSVDQDSGRALFDGNVVIGQGELRVAADRVEVIYSEATGDIARLLATGNVTFVTATEAAEAARADYNIAEGTLSLSGEVLLTQGASALSADSMVIDLATGAARMEGRVRTVFQQQGGN